MGDRCAAALRFAVTEFLAEGGLTHDGEGRDVVELPKDLPDLWNVNLSQGSKDSQTARFSPKGFQEPYDRLVKPSPASPWSALAVLPRPTPWPTGSGAVRMTPCCSWAAARPVLMAHAVYSSHALARTIRFE